MLQRHILEKLSDQLGDIVYSNILKIEVVSINWENINYVREHTVLKPGLTDWKAVDQLAIGDKLQTTAYLDGIGRPIQNVTRETATPEQNNNLWGDIVQFFEYDAYGREAKQHLPYTTSAASGKFKNSPSTEQTQYYANVYNETAPYSNITYYNDPLDRVKKINSAGTSWANSAGNIATYDINETTDNVQIFTIGFNSG